MADFWDVAQCSLVEVYRRFRGANWRHLFSSQPFILACLIYTGPWSFVLFCGRLWSALLPLVPLLSPYSHSLPHWPGQGSTLSDRFPYLKPILRARLLIALMMEAVSTSETSVNFYQTTWRYITEDSHLRNRRRDNLKSHLLQSSSNMFFVIVLADFLLRFYS
jgi:hypothetical protein